MVEQLLQASPASVAGLELLCDALDDLGAAWPWDRPLRILEVGAVSGTTRRVLERLSSSRVALAYLATSADAEQIDRLSPVTHSFVGADAQPWSPRDGVDALGEARFDIVLAVNACARLQLDAAALTVIRDLLVPGGLLAAVDPEPNAFWDVVFGQAVGWWPTASMGGAVSPIRSGEEWRAELAVAGFHAVGAAGVVASPWPCALFWGSAPARAAPVIAEPPSSHRITLVGGDKSFREALLDRLAVAGHRVETLHNLDFLDVAGAGARPERDPGAGEIVLFLSDQSASDHHSAAHQIAALARVALEAERRRAALWIVTCDDQQTAIAGADSSCSTSGRRAMGFGAGAR